MSHVKKSEILRFLFRFASSSIEKKNIPQTISRQSCPAKSKSFTARTPLLILNMKSRELFNGIMQAMNTHGVQIAALAEQNERVEKKIDGLYPRSNLPMIARPVQGVDYARTCNVAEYVDKKIRAHNDNVPENAPRYLEFAANRTHDDLNRSALTTMGGIIARKFGDDYGGCKTWEKLYKIRPKACEEVIEECRGRSEFHVFSQVDGEWCLREFAKKKSSRSSERLAHSGETRIVRVMDFVRTMLKATQLFLMWLKLRRTVQRLEVVQIQPYLPSRYKKT